MRACPSRTSTSQRNSWHVGVLFVVQGPSGTGKGTLIARLRGSARRLVVRLRATRRPRPGEEEVPSYYFLTYEEEVLYSARRAAFWNAEYSGNCYTRAPSRARGCAAVARVIRLVFRASASRCARRCPRRTSCSSSLLARGAGAAACAGAAPRPMTWWICACANRLLVELSQKMEYDYIASGTTIWTRPLASSSLTSTKSPSNSKRISAL